MSDTNDNSRNVNGNGNINVNPFRNRADVVIPKSAEERKQLKAKLDAYLRPMTRLFNQPPETLPHSTILTIANLTPDMLAMNLRAGYFPEISAGVVETIRQDLQKAATIQVYRQEHLFQRPDCRSTLLEIIPVRTPEIEQRLSLLRKKLESRATQQKSVAGLTSVKQLIDENIAANNGEIVPPVSEQSLPEQLLNNVESSLIDYESTWPTKLFTAIPVRPLPHSPYPNVTQEKDEDYGANIETLGKELWRVDRCGTIHNYEIRYYHSGDVFFPKIYPTTCQGLWEMAGTSFKEWTSKYIPR